MAYAQLTQLMALPEYNGDWVPDWTDDNTKFIIRRCGNTIVFDFYTKTYYSISFKTPEIRDRFMKNNLDLLKEYFDDKAIKDIKERIDNKLKNLVKQNEVMEEREDLVITSSCSAGKIVEVPKKGYLFIDLKTAKEYFKQGGLHKEIALKSGYTEAELNPIRNEWGGKFVGENIQGFYIGNDGEVYMEDSIANYSEKGTFKTEKQAKSALAYAQLTQLMALPEYNGDWVPDWSDHCDVKYIIRRFRNGIDTDYYKVTHHPISFKSREIRDKFLENNLDLLKEYFELD